MSNLEFLGIITAFVFLLCFPLLVVVCRQAFNIGKTPVTWTLLIVFAVYYTIFFTAIPKYVRPYLQSHMETVQVCTFKQVLKDH